MHIRPLLIVLLCGASPAVSQTMFPDTGRAAIHQHALELRNTLRVLSISLRPGHEDLTTLASLRLSRGASVLCAYMTNGESGDADDRDCFPFDLAVLRREEASRAVGRLDIRAVFWNMPDRIGGGNAAAEGAWDLDSLRIRMERTILQFQPDMILIHRDPDAPEGETPLNVVAAAVAEIRNRTARRRGGTSSAGEKSWDVSRVWAERNSGPGVHEDVDAAHPIWRRTYRQIAADAAAEYRSLRFQRTLWAGAAPGGTYRLLYPSRGKSAPKTLSRGLPVSITGGPAALRGAMDSCARALLGGRYSRIAMLRNVARLIDSVDLAIAGAAGLPPRAVRRIVEWKQALEALRVALLGVTVRWSQDEGVVTERQLFTVRIDTVTGVKDTGRLEIYFPVLQQAGWILNEAGSFRLPLRTPADFRLVTPQQVEYDLPGAQTYPNRPSVGHEVSGFVIHSGMRREENFVYRLSIKLRYAPRFMTQVLTPFVRCMPGEEVVVRLSDNSRDGVMDAIAIRDSLVQSDAARFRLPGKGMTQTVRLPIVCNSSFREGTLAARIAIGQTEVARAIVRAFDITSNVERRVGLIAGKRETLTREAIRRAGWRAIPELDSARVAGQGLDSLDVLVIDRRALTLAHWIAGITGDLERFVARGGHLVILAQDAAVWNSNPLWSGISLTPSGVLTEGTVLQADSTQPLLAGPNRVSERDLSGWAFRVGYNTVSVRSPEFRTVIRTAGGNPLVLTENHGRGSVTYIDLAVEPPWMSLSPWSIRFLANLLSQ